MVNQKKRMEVRSAAVLLCFYSKNVEKCVICKYQKAKTECGSGAILLGYLQKISGEPN